MHPELRGNRALFNGSTSSSVWYIGNPTKQEILKNIFDQFNN